MSHRLPPCDHDECPPSHCLKAKLSLAQAPGYEAWFEEVVRFAREKLDWSPKAITSIDRKAWREYFDKGLTPKEAWQEEYDAAS